MNELTACVILSAAMLLVGCDLGTDRTNATLDEPTDATASGMLMEGEQIYVVQEGDDSFWTIAQKVYGHGKYFYVIAQANPGVDPRMFAPGDELFIPQAPQEDE